MPKRLVFGPTVKMQAKLKGVTLYAIYDMCLPSVCHKCIVAKRQVLPGNFLQVVNLVWTWAWLLSACKILVIQLRGTFTNLELNEKGKKNLRFSIENWPYLKNGEKFFA